MARLAGMRLIRFSTEKECKRAVEIITNTSHSRGDVDCYTQIFYKKLTVQERMILGPAFHKDPHDFSLSFEEWGVFYPVTSPDYIAQAQATYWSINKIVGPDKELDSYTDRVVASIKEMVAEVKS